MNVRDGMTKVVLSVGPAHTLREAARLMSAQRVGAAVVVDASQPGIGILTERDILDSIGAGQDPDAEMVADHRTSDVVFASPDWTLEQAASAMIGRKLPAPDRGRRREWLAAVHARHRSLLGTSPASGAGVYAGAAAVVCRGRWHPAPRDGRRRCDRPVRDGSNRVHATAGAVTLVTGASSGIGAATALALAAAGAQLIVTGRDEDRLKCGRGADQAPRPSRPTWPSLTGPRGSPSRSCMYKAASTCSSAMPARAGLGRSASCPPPRQRSYRTVNLLAPVQLARLLLPGMAARRAGHLVFVSSIAGVTGVRYEAVYAATKAGLNNLAESLGYELAGTGVGVSVVLPGVVDTPFFRRRGRPYERRWPAPIPSDQVARAIIRAAQRDLDVVFVPRWLRLPAWLHGTSPRTSDGLRAGSASGLVAASRDCAPLCARNLSR